MPEATLRKVDSKDWYNSEVYEVFIHLVYEDYAKDRLSTSAMHIAHKLLQNYEKFWRPKAFITDEKNSERFRSVFIQLLLDPEMSVEAFLENPYVLYATDAMDHWAMNEKIPTCSRMDSYNPPPTGKWSMLVQDLPPDCCEDRGSDPRRVHPPAQ